MSDEGKPSGEAPQPGSAQWFRERQAEARRWRELNPEAAAKQAATIKDQLARLAKDRGSFTASLLDELIEQDRAARRKSRGVPPEHGGTE